MSIHVHVRTSFRRAAPTPYAPPASYRTALWKDLRARRGGGFHPLSAIAKAFRRPAPR